MSIPVTLPAYGAKAQTTRPGPQATSRTVSFGPGQAASTIIFNASLSLIMAAALKGNAWRENWSRIRSRCVAMPQILTSSIAVTRASSFDHLIGAGEQGFGHLQAEHPGSRQIDDEIEFSWLLNWNVRWF